MKLKKLTNKELDVLRVLWDSEDPLLASEIYKIDPSLNSNTVQAALRNLTKKGYIKVADIVYSGTVLSRRYTPIVTQPEYVKMFFPATAEEKLIFMEGFIQDIESQEELDKVQKLLDDKKAELNK
ncbi:MAG: BlaI/MecI/CopY family transcriptional regulator [Eubacterium sp.]|jgi:predicted transcriptional regulator|nr:BlaI/MecI/CopY family transcriptional regulator [Eubacterium sp.]MCH4047073.1 BlaI/MecI/CopY family transcriptional regulator [Eubacterium sp.]MCH4080170.1 BlaI/MecI/CopY family transcriptional regulator [Eubacterium sp.]MCH4110958.1 BlaI/MecI/CopY family transcriptional regulator [Eubacterium sp.]MCI1306801.1 BlaI/MecI/CopY family transcriptional regulator [Eubacterium sp.]